MTIKYCLKTLKLCIIILNISYILGLLWLILTEVIQFYTHFDYQQQLLNFQEEKFDIDYYCGDYDETLYNHRFTEVRRRNLGELVMGDLNNQYSEFTEKEDNGRMAGCNLYDQIVDFYKYNDFFREYYKFYLTNGERHETHVEQAISVTYFAFTSLSTVGFGDFTPRSNLERIFGSMILLFGVAIFSYIMGNFIDILDQFKNVN